MHILFEALDKKRGMTLHELAETVQKVRALADDHTKWGQAIQVEVTPVGTIKQFEIEV